MGKHYQHRTNAPGAAPVRRVSAQSPAQRTKSAERSHAGSARARQGAYGNQAVQRMLEARAVQAKLSVTPPTDAFEQEAERAADQVLHMNGPANVSETAPQVHRLPDRVSRAAKDDKKKDAKAAKPGPEKKKDDDKVKRAAAPDDKKKKDDTKKDEKKKKEDDKVKRAADADGPKEDDDEKVQRAAASAESVPDVSPELERNIASQKSAGAALPDSLRSYFEPRFGKDLGNVRLHTDSQAAAAAKDLKAQAFTHGQDIYFAGGRYQPNSDAGKHLLAHEITHTLQQSTPSSLPAHQPHGVSSGPLVSRGADAQALRRNGDSPPAAAPAQGTTGGTSLETGLLNGDSITFDKVSVPGFKLQAHRGKLYNAHRPLKQKKGYERGDTDQRNVWKNDLGAKTTDIEKKLKQRYEKAVAADKDKSGAAPSATDTYIFKAPGNRYFIGDLPTVAKEMTLPTWTRTGAFHKPYDVDHIVELQLADWGGSGAWANTTENMELLDSSINRSSGSQVKNSIADKVKKFIDSTQGAFGKNVPDIKSNYNVLFNDASPDGAPGTVGDEDFWEKEDIAKGLQVDDKVNIEIVNANSLGGDGKVLIFPSAAGGIPKTFTDSGKLSGDDAAWLKPFRITAANFVTDAGSVASPNFGSITIEMPPDHEHFKPMAPEPIPLTRIPGAQYAGSIDKAAIRAKLASLRHKKMSPITVNEPDVTDKGITVTGSIHPDLPILQGKSLDFELAGDDVTLSVEFGMGDLNVPKPFIVKGSTIRIFASTGKGLGAEGQVDFGIEHVGEGFLQASIGTSEGLNVLGQFSFDTSLFDPAIVKLGYENNEFKGSGTLGIPEGKVTGIKKATVTASYESDTFKANGNAELTIPGIKQGNLDIVYSDAAGLKIAGDFTLRDDIPGLKGGSAKVALAQGEGGAGYKLKADLAAQPAIPGFNTEVTGTYDDGAITLSASAGYSRGMMSGNLTLGATNRGGVDDNGNPTGPPTKDKFVAFGSGQVKLTLTSWLQGTVGIRVKPNAEVELKGKLGLPSSVDLFPKKELNQQIFAINVQIPVFPPIAAEVGGSLDAYASFGPGQLQDLEVDVTYNPEREEDTLVHGSAKFVVPADAGLRLEVHGGIVATALVASVGGDLGIGGSLGLHAEADVGVDVSWSKQKGIDVQGTAHAEAEPQFAFDVTGSVHADLGAGPISYRLYEHKWQLAKFTYGSNLHFGVTLPIHYVEGQPFDVQWKDIQIEKPEISFNDILKDLIAKVS